MDRVRVRSESLKSVGYDAMSNTLEVQFKNGRVFQYYMVPPFLYSRLLEANAKGNFVENKVRYHYKFKRMN